MSRLGLPFTHFFSFSPADVSWDWSQTKLSATGCEASLILKYDYCEKHLKIAKSNLAYNHPTNPDTDTYVPEYQVKRLAQHELKALKEIDELNPRNENLMHMVNVKYNKAFPLSEIRRLKHQLQFGRCGNDMQDLLDNLEGLQDHGQVKVLVSNNGNDSLLDMVAFATPAMIAMFCKYPEVIYVDGTYKSNKRGLPLYQIMVEDGLDKTGVVFYAFVRQETADLLAQMMGVFVEYMGESISKIECEMVDKDPNEINAIKMHIPNVSPMLCAFHVHKAMKARVYKLQCPKEVNNRLQQLAYRRCQGIMGYLR